MTANEHLLPPEASLVAKQQDETFTHTLADGQQIVCGKPQGVLKLKLRQILDADLLKDPEIKTIAEAFLSVRTVGGLPFQIRTSNEFEFFMNRFKSEADLDEFVDKYTHLVNPELAAVLDAAVDEAFERNMDPDAMKEHVTRATMEYERAQRKKVRD